MNYISIKLFNKKQKKTQKPNLNDPISDMADFEDIMFWSVALSTIF